MASDLYFVPTRISRSRNPPQRNAIHDDIDTEADNTGRRRGLPTPPLHGVSFNIFPPPTAAAMLRMLTNELTPGRAKSHP